MVFNTGAALLDAIVLAVVSNESEGTYGYKSHRMYGRFWRFLSLLFIPCSADFKKTNVWKPMIKNTVAENRRYYKVTEKGKIQLDLYRTEWKSYSTKISTLFEGGIRK